MPGMDKPELPLVAVVQDEQSWIAGYKAGRAGTAPPAPPNGVDALAWISGVIEGRAARLHGRVRPPDPQAP
jgi:hypothetical protein